MRPYTTAGGKDAHGRVESVNAAGRHGHPDLGRARARRGEARMIISGWSSELDSAALRLLSLCLTLGCRARWA